jgi:hypothetical protein
MNYKYASHPFKKVADLQASELNEEKKNSKRTEKGSSGWCSVQTFRTPNLTSGICNSKHVSLRRVQISRQVCTWPVGVFNEGKDPSIYLSDGQTKQARFVASCNQNLSNLFDSRLLEPSHALAFTRGDGWLFRHLCPKNCSQ